MMKSKTIYHFNQPTVQLQSGSLKVWWKRLLNTTLSNNLNPVIYYNDSAKIQVKVNLLFWKQCYVIFKPKELLNFCPVCEINWWPQYAGYDFALGNSMIGAVKLTKNAKLTKCKSWLNIVILVMTLDLMQVDCFQYQMVKGLVML